MRLGRVVPVCAAAVASVALFTTGVSAFQHPSPNGRCHVSIEVVPRHITVGESVTIFGRLICLGRGSAANRVVRLYHHVPGVPGFTLVQTTTTDTRGFYQFQRADGAVETDRIWHVRAHGAESVNKGVRVSAQVTLSGPPEGTQILTGSPNKITFTGTVNPADVGARVILQRQSASTGDEWHRIDLGRVEPGGTFSIMHTFIVPGDADIRVLVRSRDLNAPSPSNVLSYEISQAQNPALTIVASADPIAYGQSVTISGVLAGGASQPVTLLARIAHQRGLTEVAQATTDASGNYVFPAQAPVNSTFYRVTAKDPSCAAVPPPVKACKARRLVSAVLYEGVKEVLTAQVSATSVPAGGQLTFSGSVAPGHPGHIIYLERQNASSQLFHIARVAFVNPDSTYSINYTPYSAGTAVFRVHIPGGPENEGAVSQLFTVQVTPAPAATLAPEAPGNASQPAEGSTSPSGNTEGTGEREGEPGSGQEGAGERETPHPGHRR